LRGIRFALVAAVVVLVEGTGAGARPALAQTSGATLQREQKPTYPEGLNKIGKQGNVVVAARIDKSGRVQDVIPLVTTNIGFVDNAVAALKGWQFTPATRGGKPIDIAANIALRFRIDGSKRGDIPRAILGDLNIYPANAAGARSGPEGFPLKRGGDPRLRVEAVLDLPLSAKAQTLALRADAVSPTGRRVNLYSASVPAKANAQSVPIAFSAPVGSDWEDGIWTVQLTLADVPVGGGQFWLAGDPEHFDFASLATKNAAVAAEAPTVAVPGPTKLPAPAAPARKPTARAKRA
jgi:TonB family protein